MVLVAVAPAVREDDVRLDLGLQPLEELAHRVTVVREVLVAEVLDDHTERWQRARNSSALARASVARSAVALSTTQTTSRFG